MKKKICLVDTLYSLFLYVVLNKEYKDTLYFFGENIPVEIIKKFENKVYLKDIKIEEKNILNYFTIRKINKAIKKRIKNYDYLYFQDHISYSQFFMNNFQGKKILLEDGIGNYNIDLLEGERKKKKKWNIIKKIKKKYIYFEETYYSTWGTSNKVDQILLTNLYSIPEVIRDKVRIVNLEKKWQELSEIEREGIIRIFNFNLNELFELNKLKNSILLLTQCYSEDKFLSEKDKISLYKTILKDEKNEILIIKPHPREITDYSKVFKEKYKKVIILNKNFPAEIMMLLGIKVNKIITIDSSVIFNFKNKYKTQIYGAEYLKKYIENIRRSNVK